MWYSRGACTKSYGQCTVFVSHLFVTRTSGLFIRKRYHSECYLNYLSVKEHPELPAPIPFRRGSTYHYYSLFLPRASPTSSLISSRLRPADSTAPRISLPLRSTLTVCVLRNLPRRSKSKASMSVPSMDLKAKSGRENMVLTRLNTSSRIMWSHYTKSTSRLTLVHPLQRWRS